MPGTNMPGTSQDFNSQNHRAKKTTHRQFEIMVDFISKHREMEHQKFTPSFTQKDKDELWRELSNLLNADGYGPLKKPDKWRKTWTDYKSEIKRKHAEMMKEKRKTGNVGREFAPLPPLYEKVLGLIDSVLITGDESVPETGRNEELVEAGPSTGMNQDDNNISEVDEESSADICIITDTPSNNFMQARKHRRIDAPDSERRPGVSRKNFTNLVDTEADKTTVLRELSAAVERGNLLKEKELELMEKKMKLNSSEIKFLL